MDKAIGQYVKSLLGEPRGKPSILLLDEETTGIISLCTTQSQILKHDIYLVDKISNTERQKLRHMDCICFLRPSSLSIGMLLDELKDPRYATYKLHFSNALNKSQIERLAEADDHEVVESLMEMFLDYSALNSDFFVSNVNGVLESAFSGWREADLERCADSLVAMLATLGVDPDIRYESKSRLTKQLANEVSRLSGKEKLVSTGQNATLVILDRTCDPISALLTHWTYQAMIDELIGLQNNRVRLDGAPNIDSEMRDLVVDQKSDDFFKESMFMNFGDLGAKVKEYVTKFQAKTKSNANFESVADMRRFVEDYPGYRKLSGNVSKHVTLVGELSRRIEETNLLEVSELEQNLACSDSHVSDYESLQKLLRGPNLDKFSRYRLVALYALRYNSHSGNKLNELLAAVETTGFGDPTLRLSVENLAKLYSGQNALFEGSSGVDSFFTRAQSGLKGLKGVENVYTQYKSRLHTIVASLYRGSLSAEKYPAIPRQAPERSVPKIAVIYVVGGATFEEAQIVAEHNETKVNPHIILGGTSTINKDELLQSYGFITVQR